MPAALARFFKIVIAGIVEEKAVKQGEMHLRQPLSSGSLYLPRRFLRQRGFRGSTHLAISKFPFDAIYAVRSLAWGKSFFGYLVGLVVASLRQEYSLFRLRRNRQA